LTFRLPVLAPVVVGLNVTLIVHELVPVAGKLAGQVLAEMTNPEPAVAPVMVAGFSVRAGPPVPLVLVTVTDRATPVVLITRFPNASVVGVTV
jgi:hypothetical protein